MGRTGSAEEVVVKLKVKAAVLPTVIGNESAGWRRSVAIWLMGC